MRKWIALILIALLSAFVFAGCEPTAAPTALYPTITPGQAQTTATGVNPKGETPQTATPLPTFPTGPLTLTVSDILDLSFINPNQGWLLGANCEIQGGECQSWPILLRATTNGGLTWSPLPAPLANTSYSLPPSGTLHVSRVLFCSETDGWLYGPAAFSTTDGGHTWMQAPFDILALDLLDDKLWSIQSGADNLWFVATSADHGRTWQKPANQPKWLGSAPQLAAFNGQQAWVMANQDFTWHLWKTADGGATWMQLPSTAGPYRSARVLQVTADGTLWLFSADQPTTATQNKALHASSDGGTTWQVVATPPQDAQTPCKLPSLGHLSTPKQVAAASNESFFMALERYTLLRTANAGCDWTEAVPAVQANLGDATIGSVTFVDSLHGWAPAPPDRLFITVDGGANWQMVTVP